MRIPDGMLVQYAQRGSERAFRELVERYHERIINVCYRMLGNREDAEETAIEAFLACHQSLGSFEGRSSFATWLYRIAIHTASKRRRTRPEHESVPIESITPSELSLGANPEKRLYEQEIHRAIEQAIGYLPDHLRATVVLHFLEGLTYQQIAEILDCPIGTVSSRINHARKQLQRRLKHLLDE